MFCSGCGAQNPDNSRFCAGCGRTIGAAAAPPPRPAPPPPPPPPPPQYAPPQYAPPPVPYPQQPMPGYPPQAAYGQQPFPGHMPGVRPNIPSHMFLAIVSTVCVGCLPLGILAIMNASSVKSKMAVGDYAGAMDASRKASRWGWTSIITGVIVTGLAFAIQGEAIMQAIRQGR